MNITDIIAAYENAININDKVRYLRQIINQADLHYYINDNPILSDAEYDAFFSNLKALENEYPELITIDSPTQRIAYGLSEQFKTVTHLVPMLSLENSYNADDLRVWDKRIRETIDDGIVTYSVEPKYDGAGISLIYENERLTIAATRGDGLKGEDITTNARQIRTIPLSATFSKENIIQIEMRGEVMIKKDTFKQYNLQRLSDGLAPLANPRNAASGTLRMLDPKIVKERGLFAIIYSISHLVYDNGEFDYPQNIEGHFEAVTWLHSLGFSTPVSQMRKCNNIDEVIAMCDEFEAKRDTLEYEIDGMVVKVNSFTTQDKLGMTSHHPRWAIAYKFKPRQATSTLLEVEFQVGRTGTITPVAKIKPIAIGGVTVSSISLFNEDIIKEKDIRIGDTVLVERAGDVIPYIVKSIPENRTGNEQIIDYPSNCPICSQKLVQAEGEVAWRCINNNCPAQIVEKIIHFASKNAMDIKHLGAVSVKKFYDLGLIKSIPDIYRLDYDTISQLDKFGQKSVENLKLSIEKSKKQPLHRLIFALGIRYVGETTAKVLAGSIDNIFELQHWDLDKLSTLEDIGHTVGNSIINYFKDAENMATIQQLSELGVAIQNFTNRNNELSDSKKLLNQSFLFTGTLEHMKRSEAEALVEEHGGKVLSSVSSKLNFLIVGKDAGSKLEKAKRLDSVSIISEQDFLKMINK